MKYLLIFLFSTSCATNAVRTQNSFQIHSYSELQLENGLRILAIKDSSLPRVSVGILINTGSYLDPKNKSGLNHFTANMLEQGSKKRTATQIADDFAQIASDFSASASSENTYFSASALSEHKEKLLELFSETLLTPSFDFTEIRRQQAQVIALIQKKKDNPAGFADELLEKATYGYNNLGEEKDVASFTQNDLINFYQKNFLPEKSILFLTGNFDENFLQNVKTDFANWKRSEHPVSEKSILLLPIENKIIFNTKAELKQTQIRMAQVGVPRSNLDYLKLKVANLILGGDFVSRLNLHVRDKMGLTYNIHSYLDARLQNGLFVISTFTRNEKVKETIQETRKILLQFISEGVTQEELDAAKSLLIGQFPASIETTDKLAYSLLLLRRYHVNDDYLKKYIENIQAIKLSEVNAAIKRYYNPEQWVTLVYADKDQVEKQIKGL